MERKAPNRDLTDLERRMANVVRFGTIAAADYQAARVRVKMGALTSGWLPFTAARAHDNATWDPPQVGEQVVLVAPGGDLTMAVVVGALYQNKHPAPGDRAELHTVVFADGSEVAYDEDSHTYTVDVTAAGKILLRVGASTLKITDSGITMTAPAIDHFKA